MKILTSILLFLLSNSIVFSQSGWYYQNFGGNDLNSIRFVNSNTGWAVGYNGTIMKTTNGGSNWSVQSVGAGYILESVDFADVNTGWTVGWNFSGGKIFKTTNGGTNWLAQSSGIDYDLYSTDFINASTGWIVGSFGTILKTTNGGTNWLLQNGPFSDYYSVIFTNVNTGWAVGLSGKIVKTTNGGTNWISQTSGVSDDLFSVCFTDANTGWAVGLHARILKTTNGGTNWSVQSIGATQFFESVDFANASTGWVVGSGGILNTTNGGTNWTQQITGTTNSFFSVDFINDSTGWVAGFNGRILKTVSGGANVSLSLKFGIQGFWNNPIQVSDTVRGYLRNAVLPYNIIDSGKVFLNSNGDGILEFISAPVGTYYLSIVHRNSLQTWSKNPVSVLLGSNSYDFTTDASKAYGDNLILKSSRYCNYSGDVNQDETIDATDLCQVENGSSLSLTGYVVTDVNGDGIVNAADLNIVNNNVTIGPSVMKP